MSQPSAFAILWLYILLCCFFFPLNLAAQVQNGQITGIVTDPSGGVVVHATILIENPATGYRGEFASNADGIYTATELLVGTYKIDVTAPGFKTMSARNLVLNAGTVLRIDFKLLLGQQSESVEVKDATKLVNTENSHLAYTVDSSEIDNLPLNGRNIYDLIQYQPGATNVSGIMYEKGANTVVNGVRENFNGFLINGIPNTGLSGGPMERPIQDTLQEFQVLTLNNSVEYGSSAGAITNVVTKSGSNVVHGSLWEYIRNDIFDANPFYANAFPDPNGPTRSPLRLNQFGTAVGGPIKQDKLFFFAAYQGERFLTSSPGPVVTESADFRAATISAFRNSVAALLYKNFPPASPGVPVATLRDVIQSGANRFSSFADYLCPANTDGSSRTPGVMSEKFASLFGVEPSDITELNATCPGGSPFKAPQAGAFDRDANFLDLVPNSGDTQSDGNLFDGNEASIRIDYSLSPNDRFFGQFNWSRAKDKYVNANPRGFASPVTETTPTFQFAFTHTFNPRWVNELRAGFAHDLSTTSVPLPGVPSILLDANGLGFGTDEGSPQETADTILTLNDEVSILHGRHILTIGGELRRDIENTNVDAGRPGYSFYDALFFAIDAPYHEDVGVDPGFSTNTPAHLASNVRYWRNWALGAFVQDDWKILRNLTLNLGLRYDLYSVDVELHHLATTFLKGPGQNFVDNITSGAGQIKDASTPCPGNPRAVLAGECGPGGFAGASNLGAGNHHNLAPSIGFAWDVFADGKTSLRGNFSIAYQADIQKQLALTQWNPPYYSLNGISNFLDGNPNANLVYGPVNGAMPTFLGLAPAGQHSGTGAQATGNISGWDPANPQTSSFTSIIFPEGLRTPYIENWFLGVERQVRPTVRIAINYVGTEGINLFRADNVNRVPGGRLPEGTCATDNFGRLLCSQIDSNIEPNGKTINPTGSFLNPNFGRLRIWDNGSSSSYDALQISVHKRISNGFQVSGNYTYSHSIDDGSSWQSGPGSVDGTAAGDGDTTDQTQPHLDRGDSVFDIRHRFAFRYIWSIPFPETSNRLLQAILGGWQMSGIWSVQTGAHWSAFNADPSLLTPNANFPGACNSASFDPNNCLNLGGDYNLDGENNDRPNAMANNIHATHSQWANGFNLPSNFFSAPCLGCVGNLGRNTFVGPSYWDADISIAKTFPISEGFNLQFRAEAFNVFNHTNFLIGENSALQSTFFGQAGGTAPPRNLQFAVRLSF